MTREKRFDNHIKPISTFYLFNLALSTSVSVLLPHLEPRRFSDCAAVMNENPYRPPEPASSPDEIPPARKFRWRIIPLTFCWGMFFPASLAWAAAAVVLALRSWLRFVELWNAGERVIPLLALACPALSVGLVITVIACGFAWKNGRWLRAVVLTLLVTVR